MGKLLRTDLLAQVHPDLEAFVRYYAERSPYDWQVVTGVRTQAQVDEKYAEGRTRPGPHAGEPGYPALGLTVTDVRTLEGAPHALRITPEGLYSCAVDVMFFTERAKLAEGRTREEQAVYRSLGEMAESAGFAWGGRFPKVDQAHLQLRRWREFPLPKPRLA